MVFKKNSMVLYRGQYKDFDKSKSEFIHKLGTFATSNPIYAYLYAHEKYKGVLWELTNSREVNIFNPNYYPDYARVLNCLGWEYQELFDMLKHREWSVYLDPDTISWLVVILQYLGYDGYFNIEQDTFAAYLDNKQDAIYTNGCEIKVTCVNHATYIFFNHDDLTYVKSWESDMTDYVKSLPYTKVFKQFELDYLKFRYLMALERNDRGIFDLVRQIRNQTLFFDSELEIFEILKSLDKNQILNEAEKLKKEFWFIMPKQIKYESIAERLKSMIVTL